MYKLGIPSIREIEVSPDSLILDPNNPRLKLVSGDENDVPEEKAGDPGIVERTRKQISGGNDRFQLHQLESSIIANGWQPVDFIFVKKHKATGNYLVLEGNRRVMAIRNLLASNSLAPALRAALQKITVMEVLDEETPEKLKRKISYLLGVRHHGSLKTWKPFAQAHNIYFHYLERSGQTDATFKWNQAVADNIASALSLKLEDVKERLRVFRVMHQIGTRSDIKNSEPTGGVKGSYYSICKGGLVSNDKGIAKFIKQDPTTFLLDEDSAVKFEKLCHFSQPRRQGAPLNNPREWRDMGKILSDENQSKREANIQKVLEGKEQPSAVWAKRAEELSKLQWDKWLNKVSLLLKKVELGDNFGDQAKVAVGRLSAVLNRLDSRDR